VVNDQYVTIHDLQLQLNAVLEGIRILNGRVEEYDKRIEGVQQSTDKFFTEVQAENNRRSTVICQAFDALHEKVVSELTTKIENQNTLNSPPMAGSARFPTPRNDSPRMTMAPTLPNNPLPANVQFASQLDTQAQLINDIHVRYNTLQQQFASFQNLNATLPGQVGQFCDDVTQRMLGYQREQALLREQLKAFEFNLNTLVMTLTKHTQNTDNNFRETAMHMDSVKKRFAEHRKQLDNLIRAWHESTATTDQLNGKFESLKEFLSNKVVPTITKIHKSLPNLMDGVPAPNRSTAASPSNAVPQSQRRNSQVSSTSQSGGQRASVNGAGYGAGNPIELS